MVAARAKENFCTPFFGIPSGWGSPGIQLFCPFGIKSRLAVDVPHSCCCLRNDLSAKQMFLVGFWFVFLLGITDHKTGGESEPWDATRFLGKSVFLHTMAGSRFENEIPVRISGCEHPGSSRIIHCIPKHPRESRGSAGSHTPSVPISLLPPSRAIYPKCHFYPSSATGLEAESFHMGSNRNKYSKASRNVLASHLLLVMV